MALKHVYVGRGMLQGALGFVSLFQGTAVGAVLPCAGAIFV